MSRTMVTLDFFTRKEVYEFLLRFQEPIYVKIDMELMYSPGLEIVREVKAMGHQIFLDLKLHGISNTVKRVMKDLAKLGVGVVNLHTAGGSAVMKAAIEGLEEGAVDGKRPLCIAVTQLTSTSNEAMNEELLIPEDVKDVITSYAKLVKENRLDGIVCSVHKTKAIHEACGFDFPTVTPSIRLADDSRDDQKRVATPTFVKEQDCDYIVVGRSIIKSADSAAIYHEIGKTVEGK